MNTKNHTARVVPEEQLQLLKLRDLRVHPKSKISLVAILEKGEGEEPVVELMKQVKTGNPRNINLVYTKSYIKS